MDCTLFDNINKRTLVYKDNSPPLFPQGAEVMCFDEDKDNWLPGRYLGKDVSLPFLHLVVVSALNESEQEYVIKVVSHCVEEKNGPLSKKWAEIKKRSEQMK